MTTAAFKVVLQNILNRWSGLKLCVEHQSGGRQSKEKALYLIDYINEILFTNNKIECEDLEDLIAEYMDAELQTILEDDSVRDVSKDILQLFELFQTGRHDELEGQINRLPRCDLWLDVGLKAPPRRRNDQNDDSGTSSDESVEEGQNPCETAGPEPMDCEWTQVTYKRNR